MPPTREVDEEPMKTPWSACTLAMLLAASLRPAVAGATEPTVAPIPSMLVATEEPNEYPDPICSKCTIVVVEDEDSTGTRADVWIEYPEDAPHFVGEVELTVELTSGERRTLWLSHVRLQPGDVVELVAEAGLDWSWTRARFVWLRFVTE